MFVVDVINMQIIIFKYRDLKIAVTVKELVIFIHTSYFLKAQKLLLLLLFKIL